MPRLLQAVLFDLRRYADVFACPWPPVFERAGQALADSLRASGVPIDETTFGVDFQTRLDEYYAERDRHLAEATHHHRAGSGCWRKRLPRRSRNHAARRAGVRSCAVTQQNWRLEDDATPTLAALQAAGYRLGLVSNAGDTRDVFPTGGEVRPGAVFRLRADFGGLLLPQAASAHFRAGAGALGLYARPGSDGRATGWMPMWAAPGLWGCSPFWVKRRARSQPVSPAVPDAVVNRLGRDSAFARGALPQPVSRAGSEIGGQDGFGDFAAVVGRDLIDVIVQPVGKEQMRVSAPANDRRTRGVIIR